MNPSTSLGTRSNVGMAKPSPPVRQAGNIGRLLVIHGVCRRSVPSACPQVKYRCRCRDIREVQLAESLGYSSYFIIEHQNSHVGQTPAPSMYLCAVAQHTSRIRIGTMIYQLPLHNPLRLAQDAAMLDHLSRGRLEFGAGLGTHEHEFMRWHTSFAERRAMGDEALEIILKAWTEEAVTYEGKYWQFDEALPVP